MYQAPIGMMWYVAWINGLHVYDCKIFLNTLSTENDKKEVFGVEQNSQKGLFKEQKFIMVSHYYPQRIVVLPQTKKKKRLPSSSHSERIAIKNAQFPDDEPPVLKQIPRLRHSLIN